MQQDLKDPVLLRELKAPQTAVGLKSAPRQGHLKGARVADAGRKL